MNAGARRRATRPLRSTATGLLLIGVAGGLVSACSSGVEVQTPAHSAACEAATALWPRSVSGQARVEVRVTHATDGASDDGADQESADAAAWGDPAIIATCGWPALGPTDKECLDVDGAFWVVEPLSDGVRFTTFGRDPAIELLVPNAYAPEPLLLPAFGPAAKALPPNDRTCS